MNNIAYTVVFKQIIANYHYLDLVTPNDHVWGELSQNSTEVTKVTKTIKSFEISSSPSAICCWKM